MLYFLLKHAKEEEVMIVDKFLRQIRESARDNQTKLGLLHATAARGNSFSKEAAIQSEYEATQARIRAEEAKEVRAE